MFEFFEIKNKTEYNPLLVSKNAPFTQAWFFGEWQEMTERKVRRFEIKENSKTIGFFQVIKYYLLFSKNFLYIPHGPVLAEKPNGEFLKIFSQKLTQIAKEEYAVFLRFDFYFNDFNRKNKENFDEYFHKIPDCAYNSAYFQPKYEWILNIEKPEEELFSDMHPKTRYCVRLSENKGVKIEIIETCFQNYFNDFYGLLCKTAERNKFNLHPKIYYNNVFSNCEENKNAFLAVAKYGNKILAMNLILLYGETAYFVFGASGDEFKNLMAPHLAHWKTIIEVKKLGYKIYNFGAVDFPSLSSDLAVSDKFKGISRFKKRFGGEIFEYCDSYDLVLGRLLHYLYNLRKLLKR